MALDAVDFRYMYTDTTHVGYAILDCSACHSIDNDNRPALLVQTSNRTLALLSGAPSTTPPLSISLFNPEEFLAN